MYWRAGVEDHIEAGGGSEASELHGEGGLLGELGWVKPRGRAERTANHCSGYIYIYPKFYICFYFYYNLGLEFGFLKNGFRILTQPGQTEACWEPTKQLGSGW